MDVKVPKLFIKKLRTSLTKSLRLVADLSWVTLNFPGMRSNEPKVITTAALEILSEVVDSLRRSAGALESRACTLRWPRECSTPSLEVVNCRVDVSRGKTRGDQTQISDLSQ